MPFPTLETSRLALVEVTPEHAPALFHILANEDVTRFYVACATRRLEHHRVFQTDV